MGRFNEASIYYKKGLEFNKNMMLFGIMHSDIRLNLMKQTMQKMSVVLK